MAHGPEDAPEARRDKANYGLIVLLVAGVVGVTLLVLSLVQPGNEEAAPTESPPTAMPAPPSP